MAALVAPVSTPAMAAGAEAVDAALFMNKFSGEWRGTGKVLLGPDSGLKFHCRLDGDPSKSRLTFGMKGRCWIGKFAAPVFARLRYNRETNRFYGAFMDGAKGQGVDIVGERRGAGFKMKLSRGTAQGRLMAEPIGDDELKVVISLYDRRNKREIPIVAMGFAKKAKFDLMIDEPPVTGSIGR
ncbi:MAG: hypothetical protein ACTSSQ_07955 [Alphaproteobacteria bacterium]